MTEGKKEWKVNNFHFPMILISQGHFNVKSLGTMRTCMGWWTFALILYLSYGELSCNKHQYTNSPVVYFFFSFGYISRAGVAGQMVDLFSDLRNLHAVLHRSSTSSHSYHQWIRLLLSPTSLSEVLAFWCFSDSHSI